MSAATEFAPVVYIPERARAHISPDRLASVTVLHRPLHRPGADVVTAPVRLTRRGVVALAAAVAVVAVALVGLAWLSAPSGAAGSVAPQQVADTVTVQPGDTFWSIATRLAPQRDPRAEVADLQRLNHLSGAGLVPGQVLRTH
jgi:Tfp pilus assembly protein FimV